MESHYVLGEAVTDASIREFIQDFSRNKLKRALLNSSQKYNYTHTYIPNISGKNHIRITELDSVTYLPTVMKRNTVNTRTHRLNSFNFDR